MASRRQGLKFGPPHKIMPEALRDLGNAEVSQSHAESFKANANRRTMLLELTAYRTRELDSVCLLTPSQARVVFLGQAQKELEAYEPRCEACEEELTFIHRPAEVLSKRLLCAHCMEGKQFLCVAVDKVRTLV